MYKKLLLKSATSGTKSEDSVRLGRMQSNGLRHYRKVMMNGYSDRNSRTVEIPVCTNEAQYVDPIGIDDFARNILLDTFPDWLPLTLRNELIESLRGFTPEAALWIAESLWDCYGGHALATTGIAHIDAMLWSLYAKIYNCARRKHVKIANHK